MQTKKHTSQKTSIAKNAALALSVLIILFSPFAFFYVYFLDRIYPNVFIADLDASAKTPSQINNLLNLKTNLPEKILLIYQDKTYEIKTQDLKISFDTQTTIKEAYSLGRSGNLPLDFIKVASLLKQKTTLYPNIKLNESILEDTVGKISQDIDKKPTDAKFTLVNGKVETFVAEENGLRVNQENLKKEIINRIRENKPQQITIKIPAEVVYPSIKASDVNSLGIKQLIGTGTSRFVGSPASRIFNINLAASRINGTLIPPNEVFSFNKTVGDISSLSGYKQAYVIQNGQTVLGDGGGVCQVSTTLFRAAMNTGLPIVERHAHAYRVHYYEEDADPGFDATIYNPTVDFKFKNDTQNYILIQTQIDLKNLSLTFNFYGTKDSRKVEITKPKLWGQTPPPEPLYIDDPTLPVGQIRQIDWSAPGLKSQFEYKVIKDNEVINDQTFFSNFTPWQAKYQRGTKTS